MTAELHDRVEEIRAVHKAIPAGPWFWRVHLGRLALFRRHPVLRGWRPILWARRLGMDGATMDVADPAVAPEDPSDPWESCEMVKVTLETHIPDLSVMRWIAEAPEHVAYLLREVDHLRAELKAAKAEAERLQARLDALHGRES